MTARDPGRSRIDSIPGGTPVRHHWQYPTQRDGHPNSSKAQHHHEHEMGGDDDQEVLCSVFLDWSQDHRNLESCGLSSFRKENDEHGRHGCGCRVGSGSLGNSVYRGGWVDALFQIAWVNLLLLHIPIEIWGLLKRQPSLPLKCHGLRAARHETVVLSVQDLETSTFSGRTSSLSGRTGSPLLPTPHTMEGSTVENFGGTGIRQHRVDVIEYPESRSRAVGLDVALRCSAVNNPIQVAKCRCTKLRTTFLEGPLADAGISYCQTVMRNISHIKQHSTGWEGLKSLGQCPS